MAFQLKKVHPSSQSCSQETCVFCSNQLWHQHQWQRVPDGMGYVAEPCTVGILGLVQLWVQRDFPQELRAHCAVLASLTALAVGKVRVGPALRASPGVWVFWCALCPHSQDTRGQVLQRVQNCWVWLLLPLLGVAGTLASKARSPTCQQISCRRIFRLPP